MKVKLSINDNAKKVKYLLFCQSLKTYKKSDVNRIDNKGIKPPDIKSMIKPAPNKKLARNGLRI